MRNKTMLCGVMLLVVNVAMADPLLDAVTQSAANAATNKLKAATPQEVQQGVDSYHTAKTKVQNVKKKVTAVPNTAGEAVKAVEGKAKQRAAEKALDLLQ